jgi:hypothetical protein
VGYALIAQDVDENVARASNHGYRPFALMLEPERKVLTHEPD